MSAAAAAFEMPNESIPPAYGDYAYHKRLYVVIHSRNGRAEANCPYENGAVNKNEYVNIHFIMVIGEYFPTKSL